MANCKLCDKEFLEGEKKYPLNESNVFHVKFVRSVSI